jgi:hypothetical protein
VNTSAAIRAAKRRLADAEAASTGKLVCALLVPVLAERLLHPVLVSNSQAWQALITWALHLDNHVDAAKLSTSFARASLVTGLMIGALAICVVALTGSWAEFRRGVAGLPLPRQLAVAARILIPTLAVAISAWFLTGWVLS